MARPQDAHAKVELLAAAEAEFVAHGLERARVEDITARAGRSKGSFYLHFASKEEAFRQLVESMLLRLQASLDDGAKAIHALDRPRVEWAEVKRVMLEIDLSVFEVLWQNRALARLLMEGGHSAAWGFLIDELSERARQSVERTLQLGQRRGWFRHDVDLHIASLAIAGGYDRLARTLLALPKRPDFRAHLSSMQRFVLEGISSQGVDRRVSHPAAAETPPNSRTIARTHDAHAPSSTKKASKRARAR